MALSPRYARVGAEEARDDLALVRHGSGKFSPTDLAQRSFTTEDLPSAKSLVNLADAPTKPRAGSDIFESSRMAIIKGIQGVGLDRVVDSVQRAFTPDDSERVLRAEWLVVETEEQQLQQLQEVVHKLQKAFKFSNRLRTLVKLANSTLAKCDELVERSQTHLEQCNLMFAQCANEIATLTDYLSKLREAVVPPLQAKDNNEEKRNARRAEWALTRMAQSAQSMVSEMRESLDELDDLATECTKLMVQSITLLHMRGRSADFSGTGVAAGAAGVVAGAVVGVAGVVAAPATSGLSVPISLAGKSLFLSGIAALTPSSIMLSRQSQQLSGLSSLVVNLKSCLEIMNQKREEMAIAFAAVEGLDLDIKQASDFCQDAIELESSIYVSWMASSISFLWQRESSLRSMLLPQESSWGFIEDVSVKLMTLNQSVELFQASPSVWHFCKSEDAMYHALAAGRGKSPTRAGISLAFKPASVTRRATAASQVFQKKKVVQEKQEQVRPTGGGLGYAAVTEVKVTTVQQQKQDEDASAAPRGLGYVVATEVSTVQKQKTEVDVGAGGHFFQATYRDEYHPARPNSYEVYCKEREERKKMEEVKRELKNAAASQPESERDVDQEHGSVFADVHTTGERGQFDDAAEPQGGLGFSGRGIGFSSTSEETSSVRTSRFSRATTGESNSQHPADRFNGNHYNNERGSLDQSHRQAPALDEFGREIRLEPKRRYEDRHDDKQDRRSVHSDSYNRKGNGEDHDSREKRRRTSGWDSRSSSSNAASSRNMVGPGEVDDELQDEVKGECTETYGPVTKCVIYEVAGRVLPEEAVRIFVQFRHPGDATKGTFLIWRLRSLKIDQLIFG
ncbi:unnamed protein product [Phytophthora lilii]|uniref:Unnamed protein product n=1 Tax=Phytophthora lilii TaxID=2077276 RepID=A0A9W6UD16_9STRA|nr:unnamed protein product [Phytophthora lilii]